LPFPDMKNCPLRTWRDVVYQIRKWGEHPPCEHCGAVLLPVTWR
jgi:hypothetical protein